MKKRKAQVAIELFALISALVMIFLIVTVLERDRNAMIYSQRIEMDGKRVAEIVSTEINNGVVVGRGYSHRFSLPEYLATNTRYYLTVNTSHQFVELSWEGGYYLMPIITSNVTGNPLAGWNTISNNDGMIVITPG
ncbi:MAG: hypothetical protein ABIG39_03130 [Candidatus Micrarchaeota archaeon]